MAFRSLQNSLSLRGSIFTGGSDRMMAAGLPSDHMLPTFLQTADSDSSDSMKAAGVPSGPHATNVPTKS
ncbi:hypothetical protein RRG08_033192 [Elysia crispata]|uniref:Uncharacterized protein n=1 Tax=Elysia crispata TaxID=231223 RepID=A0AAE1BAI8_9GAST|nr:hypothetical protein RRG08_033192 [Elysia crispata]